MLTVVRDYIKEIEAGADRTRLLVIRQKLYALPEDILTERLFNLKREALNKITEALFLYKQCGK